MPQKKGTALHVDHDFHAISSVLSFNTLTTRTVLQLRCLRTCRCKCPSERSQCTQHIITPRSHGRDHAMTSRSFSSAWAKSAARSQDFMPETVSKSIEVKWVCLEIGYPITSITSHGPKMLNFNGPHISIINILYILIPCSMV